VDIHQAAKEGNIEAVKQAIADGADVNAIDDLLWQTPLDYAEGETADLLRKHGGKTSVWLRAGESIHVATYAGHIEAVKQHLADGVDVNAKNENGSTPLVYTALEGHKEVAELLIAKGADVNAQGDDGDTPLDWAIDLELTETAAFLRKHGGKTGEELK
jgi:ankyrin repeat protein